MQAPGAQPGTMAIDPCTFGNQAQINGIVNMLLSQTRIMAGDVGVGTLTFGTPQLVRATCPNLTVEFNLPFNFQNFVSASGTLRLSARALVMVTRASGQMTRVNLCLTNLTLLGVDIPSAPGLAGLAQSLISQSLPPEICFDVTSVLGQFVGM